MDKRKIIGVTGGLATGKTTVADMFAAKGAVKIDADSIAHRELKENADVRREVVEILGEDILTDGVIDRRKTAKKVFFDKDKLAVFCRILHPIIIREIKEEAARHKDQVIVLDAPLLIEAGLQDYVDVVIVVTAEYETQLKRAANRGISGEEAKNIIACQAPLAEKASLADFIIDTDKEDMKETKEGVDKIWKKM